MNPSAEDLYPLFHTGKDSHPVDMCKPLSRPPSSKMNQHLFPEGHTDHVLHNTFNSQIIEGPTDTQGDFSGLIAATIGNQVLHGSAFRRISSSNSGEALDSMPQSEASFREKAASVEPTFLSRAESDRDFSVAFTAKNGDDEDVSMTLDAPKQIDLESSSLQNHSTLITPVADEFDDLSHHDCNNRDEETPRLIQAPAAKVSEKDKAQALLEEVQAMHHSFAKAQLEQERIIGNLNETRKLVFQLGWDQHHVNVALGELRRTCESVGIDQNVAAEQLEGLVEARKAAFALYSV